MADPTPEEIAEATAEIRKGWSERDHALRQGKICDHDGPLPMTVPTAKMVSGERGVAD